MPYIPYSLREAINNHETQPEGPGELNYAVTRLLCNYIKAQGGVSYTTLNEVIGVLECAKFELYRRVAADYETKKCGENGDVYPLG